MEDKTKRKTVKTKKETKKSSIEKVNKKVNTKVKKTTKAKEIPVEPIIKNDVIDDEVTQHVEQINEVCNVQENKKKNYIPLFLSLALNVIFIIFILVSKLGSGKETFNLSDICEYFTGTQAKITIPNDYTVSNDGGIYLKENNILTPVAYIYAGDSTLDDFESICLEIENNYQQDRTIINDMEVCGFTITSDEYDVSYYFIYKDEVIIEFVTLGLDPKIRTQIISSINF